MQGVEDRVIGVLFGLAAGDRIGGPVRMALLVAESLRDLGAFDKNDIGKRYIKWWHEGAFDTGPIAEKVFELASSGMTLEDAAIKVDASERGLTAGCNPAHRCAPIAMLAAVEDSQLDSVAKTEARLTHRHPLAGDAASVVVSLNRALIRGVPWEKALEQMFTGRLKEIREAINNRTSKGLSKGGFAPNVLRAAIFFIHTSPSFSVALSRSVDFAGDSNYCPVLVGSIGGARWGRSAIDDNTFIDHSSLLPRLRSVATDLARGWMDADNKFMANAEISALNKVQSMHGSRNIK